MIIDCGMKQTPIQKFYFHIHDEYELVNSLITMGLDKPWRRKAAEVASSYGGILWLDMCCGTGEMALDLKEIISSDTVLVMADFSRDMLDVAMQKEGLRDTDKMLADAFSLPFRNNSFDLITISFATRNLNQGKDGLLRAFSEFSRILKPGGRLVNIETSQPQSALVRRLFHLYVKAIVTPVGYILTGNKSSYSFLTSSIVNHHDPLAFNEVLRKSNFSEADFIQLSFGAVSIHYASKSIASSRGN